MLKLVTKKMTSNHEDNETFEDENDERAQLDDYTILEIEQDRKLDIIYSFKETISREPEFYGIFSLSSYNILTIFEHSSDVILKNRKLTVDQHGIINACYIKLNNETVENSYIDKIGFNIIDAIYV
jgi:hypothetical protein